MTVPYLVPLASDGDQRKDLNTLGRLVADLDRYAAGDVPTDAELAVAPVIERWTTVIDLTSLRLHGSILGHPHLGACDGATSRAYAVDRERRWIRTYSRLN